MSARLCGLSLALALIAGPVAAQSARIIVVNGDGPGVGFNDPTPAVPVGGNPGTTVGQQALNVFQTAANRWAANLQSRQTIFVWATFTPLPCNATSGVLGAAGSSYYYANVPAAPGGTALEADTWYPVALAEKLTRQDIAPSIPSEPEEIFSFFNSRLGQPGCLTGSGWYFGLDNREPAPRIDLLAVVMHEMGHGLGVSVFPTSAQTGARPLGLPSVWERRMFDVSSGKSWIDMTSAERAASAVNSNGLVWTGKQVSNVIPSVLGPAVTISAPGVPLQDVQTASFGPAVTSLVGNVVAPLDSAGSALGCVPYGAGATTAGNIVLVDRGVCPFTQKVRNAQDAGAVAVLVANSAAGLPGMGGTDATITIPSWGITQATGAALRATAPTTVTIDGTRKIRAGTTAGLARLYAPAVFEPGSSVSHFDVSMTPSVLMEPNITSGLTTKVKNPFDLTLALLRDIGW